MQGGPTIIAGNVSGGNQKAVSFDGVNDTVTLPLSGFESDSTATVSFWAKATTTGRKNIWVSANTGSTTRKIAIIWNNNSTGEATATFTNDAGTSASVTCTGKPNTDGAWHHQLLTRSGSTFNYYYDNALCGSNSSLTGTFTMNQECLARTCVSGSQTYSAVSIDELKVFNNSFTGADVTADYNSANGSRGVQSDATLLAGFHFDELQPGDESNPYDLTLMNSFAVAGDLVYMRGGRYALADELNLSVNGTSAHPIVYRAYPGEYPAIDGQVQVTGDYIWLWGLDISDPDGSVTCQGGAPPGLLTVPAGADHVHIVNSFIHHHGGCQNLIGWWDNPGNLLYGNDIYFGGHGFYGQNVYNNNGYRYVVANIFHDVVNNTGDYMFQVYATNTVAQGFSVRSNIAYAKDPAHIGHGPLIGSKGEGCDRREEFIGNYVYNTIVEIGFNGGTGGRPSEVKVENNYVGKGAIFNYTWWGTGETRCAATCTVSPCDDPKAVPNTFQNNYIARSSGDLVLYETGNYLNWNGLQGLSRGVSAFLNPDVGTGSVIDNNTYATGSFSSKVIANNSNTTPTSIGALRTALQNAGAPAGSRETNSTVVAYPTTDVAAVIPNEYDPKIAHVAAYNWDHNSSITVNFNGAFPSCAQCAVYKASDPIGAGPDLIPGTADDTSPVTTFTWSGTPVAIPMNGSAEFEAFIVRQTN